MNGTVAYTCTYGNARDSLGNVPNGSNANFNWASSTCTYTTSMFAPTTTISTSTAIAIYGSMTAGEILMITMMFILIMIEMIKMLARSLDRIKTKKKFIAYSGGDVEIKDVL